MKPILKIVCPKCGSDDVCCDAASRWDIGTQSWELSSTYDDRSCSDCGYDSHEFAEVVAENGVWVPGEDSRDTRPLSKKATIAPMSEWETEIIAGLEADAAPSGPAHSLDARELATVLAALRYWQREGLASSGHEHAISSNGDTFAPLTLAEVDALAERLNAEEVAALTDPANPA